MNPASQLRLGAATRCVQLIAYNFTQVSIWNDVEEGRYLSKEWETASRKDGMNFIVALCGIFGSWQSICVSVNVDGTWSYLYKHLYKYDQVHTTLTETQMLCQEPKMPHKATNVMSGFFALFPSSQSPSERGREAIWDIGSSSLSLLSRISKKGCLPPLKASLRSRGRGASRCDVRHFFGFFDLLPLFWILIWFIQ